MARCNALVRLCFVCPVLESPVGFLRPADRIGATPLRMPSHKGSERRNYEPQDPSLRDLAPVRLRPGRPARGAWAGRGKRPATLRGPRYGVVAENTFVRSAVSTPPLRTGLPAVE